MKSVILAFVVVALAGCSGEAEQPQVSATTAESVVAEPDATTDTTAGSEATPMLPPELPVGIEVTSIELDGDELLVAVADTYELRRQGLMFVDDLQDLDGMLFVFEGDTDGRFWMKNTLLPLDIAFFDVNGDVVNRLVMEPCEVEPCPTYSAAGEYRYALEMEAGAMSLRPQRLTYQD